MIRARIVLPLSAVAALCVFYFAFVGYARAQIGTTFDPTQQALLANGCPPGETPATASDVPLMLQANITGAKVGMCWNRNSPYVGQSDAEAKQYLRSILCTGSAFGGAGPDLTVQKLDAKFAVCAARFIKSASTQVTGQVALYGGGSAPLCLREGYRTPEQQEKYAQEYRNGGGIACTKGAACEHPRGIAIDINASGDANYQKLWAIAPQFNLNFYLKARDKVHFVPTSGACSGGGTGPAGTLPASNFDFPQDYGANVAGSASQSPLSSLMNGIRSMLGMSQPTPQYLQPQTIQPQTQPTTGSQTFYDANGQPYTYNAAGQAISSVTGQPINPSQPPTLNTTNPNAGPGQTPTINNTGIFATSSNSSGNTNDNSDINYINGLANTLADQSGNSSTNSASGSAQLNSNLGNVQGTVGQNPSQPYGGYQYPIVLPPEVTQTFGSPNTTGDLTYSSNPSSPFQQFLGRLKGVLQVIASLLRPFGGGVQNQQIVD